MEEKRLVPKRRFKDYLENWKLKKISDVGEIIGGGTPNTAIKEYWNGSINWFSPTEIGDKPYVFESQKKITELGLQYSSAKVLPAQKTVLFTSRAGIGDMAILAKDAATNQGFQSIVVKEDSDVYFIYSMGFKIKEYALKNASGSTFLEISGKELSKAPVVVPEVKEQQKIGEFFRVLDERIANQERKIAKVKALKEAYLNEMFPQEGERVPKRRFQGFEGEWEVFLLGDVIISEAKGHVNANMLGGTTPYLETEYLNGGKKSYVSAQKNVDKEDVLILWDGSNAGTVYHGFEGALGSTLKVYKPKYNGSFLYYFLKRHQKLIYTNYRTPNIPHVINTFTNEFEVIIPNLEEQEKIAAFFKNLDNQIEAEEAKLEKLKKMKEAYLEEMFV